jgi:tRNA(fMet)-specific endonuclease VapC
MLYTLDTNFVSQIINENQACKARLNRAVQELHRITISPIVFWEAKRGLLKPEYALKLARLEQFANTYPCLWFDKEAADTASSIHFDDQHRKRHWNFRYAYSSHSLAP